jgi:hypothetical protein
MLTPTSLLLVAIPLVIYLFLRQYWGGWYDVASAEYRGGIAAMEEFERKWREGDSTAGAAEGKKGKVMVVDGLLGRGKVGL